MTKYISMNKSFALLFTVLIFFTINACQQTAKAPTSGPKTDLSSFTVTDIGGGVSMAIREENGRRMEEGTLINGVKHGTWVNYHTDGKLTKLTSFINGQQYGKELTFENLMQVNEVKTYAADKMHGRYNKYKRGRDMDLAHFSHGVLDGPSIKYFQNGAETGKVQQTMTYKNGQLNGDMEYYNTEGKVTVKYNYKNGEKLGGGLVK